MWFVKIEGVTNGWFVVYMWDEVEDRLVVAHDKANGWWELWGSMKRDEFCAHEVRGLLWTRVPFSKNCLSLQNT